MSESSGQLYQLLPEAKTAAVVRWHCDLQKRAEVLEVPAVNEVRFRMPVSPWLVAVRAHRVEAVTADASPLLLNNGASGLITNLDSPQHVAVTRRGLNLAGLRQRLTRVRGH